MSEARPAAAIVLAGGAGRRLGGRDKPALRFGADTLLQIALAAAGWPDELRAAVVVGPARQLPEAVIQVREDPPGAGPAAAVAAGCAALPDLDPGSLVAVLAADLPQVTRSTMGRLCAAVARDPASAGAQLVDRTGRAQLVGVWRHGPLAAAVARRASWIDTSLRTLFAPMPALAIPAIGDESADVDNPQDLDRWSIG